MRSEDFIMQNAVRRYSWCGTLILGLQCFQKLLKTGKWHLLEIMSLSTTSSKCMPPPKECIWSRYDFHLWPLTLKTFSAITWWIFYVKLH